MKTTTKILCIAMFISATASSIFFSSETERSYEENPDDFILQIGPDFTLTTGCGAKIDFNIIYGPQETTPEFSRLTVTKESGEKRDIWLSQLWLKNFIASKLAYYVIQKDKEDCIKELAKNADPNHKLEHSDPPWKTLNDMTPLEIAYNEYNRSKDPKALELLELLQKAEVIPKQHYLIDFMPLPLEFGSTQQ